MSLTPSGLIGAPIGGTGQGIVKYCKANHGRCVDQFTEEDYKNATDVICVFGAIPVAALLSPPSGVAFADACAGNFVGIKLADRKK